MRSIFITDNIFFGDMRLEKYTLECQGFGQRAKRGARILRERTALTKPIEILAISMESEALKPRRADFRPKRLRFVSRAKRLQGPRKCLHFWGKSKAT